MYAIFIKGKTPNLTGSFEGTCHAGITKPGNIPVTKNKRSHIAMAKTKGNIDK